MPPMNPAPLDRSVAVIASSRATVHQAVNEERDHKDYTGRHLSHKPGDAAEVVSREDIRDQVNANRAQDRAETTSAAARKTRAAKNQGTNGRKRVRVALSR